MSGRSRSCVARPGLGCRGRSASRLRGAWRPCTSCCRRRRGSMTCSAMTTRRQISSLFGVRSWRRRNSVQARSTTTRHSTPHTSALAPMAIFFACTPMALTLLPNWSKATPSNRRSSATSSAGGFTGAGPTSTGCVASSLRLLSACEVVSGCSDELVRFGPVSRPARRRCWVGLLGSGTGTSSGSVVVIRGARVSWTYASLSSALCFL